jgi:hypothetical protein
MRVINSTRSYRRRVDVLTALLERLGCPNRILVVKIHDHSCNKLSGIEETCPAVRDLGSDFGHAQEFTVGIRSSYTHSKRLRVSKRPRPA